MIEKYDVDTRQNKPLWYNSGDETPSLGTLFELVAAGHVSNEMISSPTTLTQEFSGGGDVNMTSTPAPNHKVHPRTSGGPQSPPAKRVRSSETLNAASKGTEGAADQADIEIATASNPEEEPIPAGPSAPLDNELSTRNRPTSSSALPVPVASPTLQPTNEALPKAPTGSEPPGEEHAAHTASPSDSPMQEPNLAPSPDLTAAHVTPLVPPPSQGGSSGPAGSAKSGLAPDPGGWLQPLQWIWSAPEPS
ncbi:hypothetical protein BDV93DRAFT_558214 [Ceratobasidium sp. AG-I]|nr:hypothetical protein BDV93DRAFT_558214 [Ceratobasidium sp. AG-I]